MSSPSTSVPIARAASSLDPAASARVRARSRANHQIAWWAHVVIYCSSCLFFWVVAGAFVTEVVAAAWGIGLAIHGFFAVVSPVLRMRFMEETLKRDPASAGAVPREFETRKARALEELSAAIAHEIRNPITAAKSLVQQIAEDPSSKEASEQARVAVEELDRVERSISHLLRFAREEPFDPAPVELSAIVDGAIALMKERAARAHIRVTADVDPVPMLFVDGEQLRKVVGNLIGNAIDALTTGDAKDATIRVTAGQNLSGTEAWISVHDNGPGIEKELHERIFQPFFTSKPGGTGIGLAVARKVLERHGGALVVSSEPGKGAEFVLTLPVRSEPRP